MRTRIERRTRTVAYQPAPGAPVENITQEYDAVVPVKPVDMDALLYRGAVGAVALIVAGAMAWSTVSIGSLLATVAPTEVAYAVSGAFDLAWIVCLAFEWLCRYDQKRARLPFALGWVSLVVSMAAITAHGGMLESSGVKWGWAVGAVGAFVSAIAKTLWLVVMHHNKVDLTPEQRAWLDQRRSSVRTQLVVATEERALQHAQDATLATRLAIEESRNGVASHVAERVATPDDVASQSVAEPATRPAVPPSQRPAVAGATSVSATPRPVRAPAPRLAPPVVDPAELAGKTLMTATEVAAYLGVNDSTVRGWKHRGRLVPAVDNLFAKDDVDAFKATRR